MRGGEGREKREEVDSTYRSPCSHIGKQEAGTKEQRVTDRKKDGAEWKEWDG